MQYCGINLLPYPRPSSLKLFSENDWTLFVLRYTEFPRCLDLHIDTRVPIISPSYASSNLLCRYGVVLSPNGALNIIPQPYIITNLIS